MESGQFGLGRAESDDDLLNLDLPYTDSGLKLS